VHDITIAWFGRNPSSPASLPLNPPKIENKNPSPSFLPSPSIPIPPSAAAPRSLAASRVPVPLPPRTFPPDPRRRFQKLLPSAAAAMADKLRDLSQPIDVPLLDATVTAFYGTGSKEEVITFSVACLVVASADLGFTCLSQPSGLHGLSETSSA
jgi:hypothetical protein